MYASWKFAYCITTVCLFPGNRDGSDRTGFHHSYGGRSRASDFHHKTSNLTSTSSSQDDFGHLQTAELAEWAIGQVKQEQGFSQASCGGSKPRTVASFPRTNPPACGVPCCTGEYTNCPCGCQSYSTDTQMNLDPVELQRLKLKCTCTCCGLKFHNQSNLRRHQKKHFNIYRHHCSICGYKFSRSDSLKLHMKRKHDKTNYAGWCTLLYLFSLIDAFLLYLGMCTSLCLHPTLELCARCWVCGDFLLVVHVCFPEEPHRVPSCPFSFTLQNLIF